MTPDLLLRRARREAGITQSELAHRLGRSQAAVAKLERPGANPTVETLDGALSALGYRLELRPLRHRTGVDETLITRNLRASPRRRLEAFETAHAEVQELRERMRGRPDAG